MDNSPSGASSASSATSWSRLAAIELCLDRGAGGGVVGAENRRAGGDGALLVERGAGRGCAQHFVLGLSNSTICSKTVAVV